LRNWTGKSSRLAQQVEQRPQKQETVLGAETDVPTILPSHMPCPFPHCGTIFALYDESLSIQKIQLHKTSDSADYSDERHGFDLSMDDARSDFLVLKAFSIGVCDRCRLLFVRVPRLVGRIQRPRVSPGMRVRISNARFFVNPKSISECDPVLVVVMLVPNTDGLEMETFALFAKLERKNAGEDVMSNEEQLDIFSGAQQDERDRETEEEYTEEADEDQLSLHVGLGETRLLSFPECASTMANTH
jgi:hypothetical protein